MIAVGVPAQRVVAAVAREQHSHMEPLKALQGARGLGLTGAVREGLLDSAQRVQVEPGVEAQGTKARRVPDTSRSPGGRPGCATGWSRGVTCSWHMRPPHPHAGSEISPFLFSITLFPFPHHKPVPATALV